MKISCQPIAVTTETDRLLPKDNNPPLDFANSAAHRPAPPYPTLVSTASQLKYFYERCSQCKNPNASYVCWWEKNAIAISSLHFNRFANFLQSVTCNTTVWPTFLKLRATSWVPINVKDHQFDIWIINKINIHLCEDTDNINAILWTSPWEIHTVWSVWSTWCPRAPCWWPLQ